MTKQLTDVDQTRLREMIERDGVEACLSRDWDALLGMCSEGFTCLAPERPPVRGKEEFVHFLESFPFLVRFGVEVESLDGSCDAAWISGRCEAVFQVDQRDLTGHGTFLSVATRATSGWLFQVLSINWDAPPA